MVCVSEMLVGATTLGGPARRPVLLRPALTSLIQPSSASSSCQLSSRMKAGLRVGEKRSRSRPGSHARMAHAHGAGLPAGTRFGRVHTHGGFKLGLWPSVCAAHLRTVSALSASLRLSRRPPRLLETVDMRATSGADPAYCPSGAPSWTREAGEGHSTPTRPVARCGWVGLSKPPRCGAWAALLCRGPPKHGAGGQVRAWAFRVTPAGRD